MRDIRLTPAQVDVLDYVYGLDGAGLSPEARVVLAGQPVTVASLIKRGLITSDYQITPLGQDVLFTYR